MMNEVRKLPLWKGLLEKLQNEGIKHGKTYDADYFEKELSCHRNSREFGLAVSKIRTALEFQGFYLDGHVMKNGTLVIVPPLRHYVIARNSERINQKHRSRKIALLTATDLNLLPAKIRPLHEKQLRRMEIRQLMERQAGKAYKYIKKHEPKMLESKA